MITVVGASRLVKLWAADRGPKPIMLEISAYDGDLHLQAVGDPSDLKALDFKVHPDGGLVVTVKNILAKPAGAKKVIREAARMLHSRQWRSGGNQKSTHWEPLRRWSMQTDRRCMDNENHVGKDTAVNIANQGQ